MISNFIPLPFSFSDVLSSQAAFAPSHLVPYIEPTADPVLQSRLFSYPDTHRHRLGANYQQLPVNAPLAPVANFQRDGPATYISQGNRPNYQSAYAFSHTIREQRAEWRMYM
jgi:catalase